MHAAMDMLWPEILTAFWVTIKLTFWSALGSLILGVVLTAMRVSPVRVMRNLASFYINTVCNTPLTLIILFCSFGLYQNLGLKLANRSSSTFLVDQNYRLAILGFILYTSTFMASLCAQASTPSTSDRLRPRVPWD